MRIAFVSLETVYHRTGEANERLHRIVERCRDRGHEVHVCCAAHWDGDHPTFEREGVTYHAVAPNLEAERTFLWKLPVALRSIGPDVIHASADPPAGALAAAAGSTLARAPLLVEWYAEDGVEGNRVSRWTARRPDRIVAPSRLVRTWLRELGATGDRVDVVPNPIDVDLIESVSPGDAADIVYARRLDEGANLESLLLALAELRDREWRTTVIGDGPERGRYEDLARDLRIDDRVEFAGETSLEERVATYRGAHAFVHTARHCVFPTELCWALACGCVGIVEYHANSSAHELVEGRERGFRTTSERELAEAIVAAGDLEHRDYDDAFEGFDRRAVLDRYLESYRELQAEYGLL